jgi:hypothetical protein
VMSCQEKAFAIPVPGGNPFQSRSLVWPSSRVHNIVTNIRLQTALGRVHRAYRKSGIARGEGGEILRGGLHAVNSREEWGCRSNIRPVRKGGK